MPALLGRDDCRIDFDHRSPTFADDPIGQLNAARERCAITWTEAHGGYWLVTGYRAAYEILQDDDRFSSAFERGGVSIPQALHPSRPLDIDPPEYLRYRRSLTGATAPRAAAALEGRIAKWTTEAIDAVIDSGHGDVVEDIGGPVPARAIVAMMGLPDDNWARYAKLYHTVFANSTDPVVLEYFPLITGEIYEALSDRRQCPVGDLMSDLLCSDLASFLGETDQDVDEVLSQLLHTLLGAGIDTTTNMFANTVMWLSDHPEAQRLLAADPASLDLAVEEFFRYFATVPSLARTVVGDVDLAGHQLRDGDRVLVSFLGANHDPEMFDRPDEVILDRSPNRHMTFGVGLHRCLGSHLARVVFPTLLREVLNRMEDLRVDKDGAVRYADRGDVFGWAKVPFTFQARHPATTA